MRLLIATPLYPPDIGGPATYAKLLKDELPKRGVSVDVVNFGDVRHLPKGMRHAVYFLKLLWHGGKADAIYAQDPVSTGVPAMWAARFLRKPFFLKIVGDYAWEQSVQREGVTDSLDTFAGKRDGYGPLAMRLKRAETRVANAAQTIIVPSDYLKRIILQWGIDADKIHVIYNAFDPVNIPLSKKEAKAEHGLSRACILSAGRLVPWKGFDTLIRLMPNVQHRIPEAELVIAGEGPDGERLRQVLLDAETGKTVSFVGRLPKEVLFEYVRAADVFVLNTFYEGLSHQLLEVMSIGTPIITTDVGGNTELITRDVEGELVRYNDAKGLSDKIVSILLDKQRADRFAVNAQKKAQTFPKERMLDELVQIFHDTRRKQ